MKELNLEIISIAIVCFILSFSEILNINFWVHKEIVDLESRIDKFELIADSFKELNHHSRESELIQNIQRIRNTIFWNSDKKFSSGINEIQYPIIVNADGKNIENKKGIVSPLRFSAGEIIILTDSQLVLAFPIQLSKYYLLIPLSVKNPINITNVSSHNKRVLDKYQFSTKIGFHLLRLDFLLQLILWEMIVLYVVTKFRKIVKHRENTLSQKNKSNERKFFKYRDLLEKCHSLLSDQSFSFINRYHLLSQNLAEVPIPTKIAKENQHLDLVDVFSGKSHSLDDLFIKTLRTFDENIKNSELEIIYEHNIRGTIFCDVDLIISIILVSFFNILKTNPLSQEIKISTSFGDGGVFLELSGKFTESIKEFKYPSFLRIFITEINGTTIKRVFIPALTFQDFTSKTNNLCGENVVPLFNN